MVVTMQQVLDALNPFEPDYSEAKVFGSEALPHLEILVKTAESLLASKAASMASMIQDEKSVTVLLSAAQSKFRQVRVAAAFGSRNLRIPEVNQVLDILKDDQDENIRNISRKSIELKRQQIEKNSESGP